MSKNHFLTVDAGTGSVRAVLFDLEGNQTACVQQEWDHKEDPRYPFPRMTLPRFPPPA